MARTEQCDGEPAIGGTEQDRSRVFGTIVIEAIYMRMPSATCGKETLRVGGPNALTRDLRRATSVAFHPEVFGLERGSALEETERPTTVGRSAVHEPVPRKIVEMPVSAGIRNLAGTDRHREVVFAFSIPASGMDEVGLFRAIWTWFDLENPESNSDSKPHSTHRSQRGKGRTGTPILASADNRTRFPRRERTAAHGTIRPAAKDATDTRE